MRAWVKAIVLALPWPFSQPGWSVATTNQAARMTVTDWENKSQILFMVRIVA
jgi:hypothetical protein